MKQPLLILMVALLSAPSSRALDGTALEEGEAPWPGSQRTFGHLTTGLGAWNGFVSEDGGRSWRRLPPLPSGARVAALVMLDEQTLLARSTTGGLFRAALGTPRWEPSPTSADDAARLARLIDATADEPLSCLQAAPAGRLVVTFGVRGCFGGDESTLELSWGPLDGELSVQFDPMLRRVQVRRRHLELLPVRARLEQVRALALRPERPRDCFSTNVHHVSVDVQCERADASVRERLRFTSNACSEALMVADGESAPLDGYARALGLYDWALETANR